MRVFDLSSLSRVNAAASRCSANIRYLPEYFQVDEVLPFKPDGTGGHVWLKIQKQGINTDWLATELAKFSGVKSVAIGYAGLKDRYAVTRQWFSVNLEGFDEPNWTKFETDDIQIIEQTRHGKKLKRGVLSGNRFKLRLTDIQGDKALWEASLNQVMRQGVPNYFGEQRFGRQANNLQQVDLWFLNGAPPRKRHQRSLYLSAARSWLFNLVLSQRVRLKNWNKALLGDVMLLAGTKASLFAAEQIDEVIQKRITAMDVHPTGPMWGRGKQQIHSDSLAIEQQVLTDWHDWQQGLEKVGLNQERRSLRLFIDNLEWQFLTDNQLEVVFFLPAGSYATVVIRELAEITEYRHRN